MPCFGVSGHIYCGFLAVDYNYILIPVSNVMIDLLCSSRQVASYPGFHAAKTSVQIKFGYTCIFSNHKNSKTVYITKLSTKN